MKVQWFNNFLKYGIVYFIPLLIISGIFSYAIYKRDANTFLAVMKNNEKQVLDFQEKMIKEHLETLGEDINYLAGLERINNYINSGFNPEIDISVFLSSFLNRREIYSSVRIIDFSGHERFRMNRNNGELIIIPEKDLQLKKNRYYFNEIMETLPENFYLSRLDFNYENGNITIPYMPVLRVAKLILTKTDNNAFIILNYNGKEILNKIDEISIYSYGENYLRNIDGWLVSLDISVPKEKSEIINFLKTPEGDQFIQYPKGQLYGDSGLITHKKIRISEVPSSPEWNLISVVDAGIIKAQTKDALFKGIINYIVLIILSGIFTYFALHNKLNQINTNHIISDRARIFDLNPAPVIKTSAEGMTLSSNIAAKNILGLTTAPSSIYDVFDKLTTDEIKLINSENIHNFEYQAGHSTYYFTSIKENASGQIFFYGSDISINYKIQEDLKNFQTAVKQSANVIVFTDLEGKVLFANDAFEKVTGYSSKEVLVKKPAVLNSGYHSNSFYDELWSTINTGNVWAGEFYNKRKNGSFFWEKATISPVLDNNGKPRFYIAVKEDITEKKEIEAELKTQTEYAEKARLAAEKANLLKSTFLANMSHEIRTPMNAILGFTRLLLDKEFQKKDREMLDIIMNSGKSLLSLINDILDFSKIEADEIEISIVKINLSYFFESIEDLFQIQTSQKNLGFNLNLSSNLPKIVFGDENRIRQILINVIGNAIKFTESGNINVNVDWISGKLDITVTDTGIGINKDKLEEIFSPFKQSDSSTDRKYEGTGLGLAISLRLTEMMNGVLKVKSKIDEGSTFTIRLPLKPCMEPEGFVDDKKERTEVDRNCKTMVEGWLVKVENDRVLTSILRDAIADLPRHIKMLETVLLDRDNKKMQEISHELMGSYGNLGMTEIYELLKELNEGIKDKDTGSDHTEYLFQTIKKIVHEIPEEYLKEVASELLPVEKDKIDINILTADDSSVNRLLIDAMLSSISIESDFAENGIEVLEMLENKKYDILLLDIQMPKMDGIETIKRIRNNEKYNELYVFAVTANAMRGDEQKYLDIGCNDYISKPIQKDIFLKKIEHQIQLANSYSNDQQYLPDSDKIDNIITSLEQEIKIFNSERVYKIATRLDEYSSNKKISIIIDLLKESADSFDSQGLKSIIKMLMEFK